MKQQLTFHNKPVSIHLTAAAVDALKQLESSLLIEMELYFSCMIRKRVRFHTEHMVDDAQQLTDNVYVSFNTVMTKTCSVADYDGPPPVTDFPIQKIESFVPHWLKIDFSHDQWQGEYGYSS